MYSLITAQLCCDPGSLLDDPPLPAYVHGATTITPAERRWEKRQEHKIHNVGCEHCHGCALAAPSLLILSEKPRLRCQGNLNQIANND